MSNKLPKKWLLGIVVAFLLASFLGGYFVGKDDRFTPSYYFANTVGSQIIEQNKLYDELISFDDKYQANKIQYNKDMILIIDCSWWVGEINYDLKGLDIFIDGVNQALESVPPEQRTLCKGAISRFANEK